MPERPQWAPEDVDLDRPSVARVYDYYLGGSHNFAVDRELGDRAIAAFPPLPAILRENRAFLRRAVRYCVASGVTQFLDVGSGIPTVGNVHEVAQEADPQATVVYVDIDPVAVAHSRAILAGNDQAGVIQADIRTPEQVLNHPETRRMLDLDQPVAVLLFALLHFFPDTGEVMRILATLREAVAPGSLLAISQGSMDGVPKEQAQAVADMYARSGAPMAFRSCAEIAEFFTDFELVEPGLVSAPLWRPDSPEDVTDDPAILAGYVGVGRKP